MVDKPGRIVYYVFARSGREVQRRPNETKPLFCRPLLGLYAFIG